MIVRSLILELSLLLLLLVVVCDHVTSAALFIASPKQPTGFSSLSSSTTRHPQLPVLTVGLVLLRTPHVDRNIISTTTTNTTASTTALHSSLASLPATRTAIKTATAVLVAAGALVLQRRQLSNFLYPNSAPDKSFEEPLPIGPITGCPFLGNLSWMSNMNQFLFRTSAKLGSPSVWKFFGATKPIAVLAGSSTINQMLNKEFKGGVSQLTQFGNLVELFGNESLSFETQSRKRYQSMRQLVGQALTEDAVAKGVPALQDAASDSIDRMMDLGNGKSDNSKIVMEDVCKYMTLEVAWRQIIGLDLQGDEEIETFHEAVKDWMKSINNFYLTFLPKWLLRKTSGYKALQYLTGKIEERIDSLVENGPDGSTMSAMVFASDEEDETKKLSRQQVPIFGRIGPQDFPKGIQRNRCRSCLVALLMLRVVFFFLLFRHSCRGQMHHQGIRSINLNDA